MTAMPASYRVERGTRLSRMGAVIGAVLLVVLIAVPWYGDSADMRIIGEIAR